MKQKLYDKFAELFGATDDAHFYFAPGRVNHYRRAHRL